MPMTYGVLRGQPDRWVREDGESTPHLQIRVLDAGGAAWRIAVNVRSDTGSEVVFWLIDPVVGHPILAPLPGLDSGFTTVAATADRALDYVRAPLFDWHLGRALPASGSAAADDLQDFLVLYLEQCHAAGGDIYAFGAKFTQNLHKPIDRDFGNLDGLHGIHDIHLNQGNRGAHASDNGVFHDGGLLLAYGGRVVGLFLGFQTQLVPTDDDGDPTSGSTSLGDLVHPVERPIEGAAAVYLERALVNPAGDDVGREVVVLGNLTNRETSLDGWRLVDKNHRITALDHLTIPAGGSSLVRLDGSGVQLGNKGGNLILLDADGGQADVVVYSGADADADDRYIRLHH